MSWSSILVRGIILTGIFALSIGIWANVNMDTFNTAWIKENTSWLQDRWQDVWDKSVGQLIKIDEEEVAPAFTKGVGTVTSKDTMILAKVISGEARGESYVGQVAVGAVVINRTKNPNFPNSVYGVVFEPGAFDAVKDGQYYQEPTDTALRAAKDAIGGWDPTNGAIYYWNPVTATSSWIWSRPIMMRIGKHVFAK